MAILKLTQKQMQEIKDAPTLQEASDLFDKYIQVVENVVDYDTDEDDILNKYLPLVISVLIGFGIGFGLAVKIYLFE